MTLDDPGSISGAEPEDRADHANVGDPATFEGRGWTLRAADCEPKTRALQCLASLPAPEPLPGVSYHSKGNVVVVGGNSRALSTARALSASLPVTLLLTSPPSSQAALLGAADPRSLAFPVWAGKVAGIKGYLGNFGVTVEGLAVIHDGSVRAAPASAEATFDLVVDFSDPPLYGLHQPPQGYWRVGDEASLGKALAEAPAAVGEFEKPRFFAFRGNLCAHSRSGIVGCDRCIEVCSTQAIRPAGDVVEVDAHLCMGCGACASVCPSGAMSYQFPRVPDRGAQLKSLLSTYRAAGGQDACILIHNGTDGRDLLAATAANGRGLPARVIPLESWHVASTGIDLLLAAIALGANQVAVLSAGSEAPEYALAIRGQMALAQQVLSALGYAGVHFTFIETGDPAEATRVLEALAPASVPPSPAAFALSGDKRTTVEFGLEHLARHAPAPREEIALAAGAPYGEVVVDLGKCTLCLSCAGACPSSALMDGTDKPLLRFLERNCVQCGLCEKTCPEDAITLRPRLLLSPAVREARVLNETQPFHCVSCGKPFGTKPMVEAMLGRLAGHSMFADAASLKRLQMCADCRVVDMMSSKSETSVLGI